MEGGKFLPTHHFHLHKIGLSREIQYFGSAESRHSTLSVLRESGDA